jgi:hypothetical protein|tara:strand:+ start:324 stop:890 length:567 start_codon:yes stop_codon:yes gene_type:complete
MNNSPIQELFLLETIETIFDASIYLYLIDGKKLFFKTNKDGGYTETGYKLEFNSEINKKSIYNFIKGYFTYSIKWYGLPRFNSPGYLNQEDFESIILEVNKEIKDLKKEGLKTANHFTDFLESQSLDPRPLGDSKYSWQANCPFSGGSHFMMISTETNTFGCGWCKKKGDQKALKDYLTKKMILCKLF